ncbi:MAG: tyrosine-protein phosphatase [Kiritimatiellae bacterium]|nr:tyrosine-protein phosphatase [Kiritimatiellia bacterium]
MSRMAESMCCTCRWFLATAFAAVYCAIPMSATAAVEPLSPTNGEMVSLLPDAQRKVMSLPTLDERLRLFAEDRKSGKVIRHDKFWRKSKPLVMKWRATAGERGPWKIEIGMSPDLSDARVWYFSAAKTDAATGRETGNGESIAGQFEVSHTVPIANLELARFYYWRVTSRGRCGFGCGPRHGCKESRRIVRSAIASFRTDDAAPRWIEIEGRVSNIRDLGGWHAQGGRRVKQGMAYRGQGLNNNSTTGETPGRNRLTVEDVKYLTGKLGIRTDLDLRVEGEIAGMKESPLGPGVKFINRASQSYLGIFFTDWGKKAMAANFRVFCDRENYPIYFHCIGGADRTGALAYVLNGVLGVDRHDLETDWESTFYPNIPDENPDPNYWCRESHFNTGFSKYGKDGDSWNRRIELYLLDCGVTEAEIETFRSIMLEQ